MADEGLLACAIFCFSCVDCIEKTDTTVQHTEYRELSERGRNKSFLLSAEYKLSDEKMIRNAHGFPICGWCKATIENTNIELVLCLQCNKFIGHPACFKKHNGCASCKNKEILYSN